MEEDWDESDGLLLVFVQVESQAQYIIEQFAAATGCRKMERSVRSVYVSGKVRMAMGEELGASAGEPQRGCFVMWQMVPDMWLVELVVAGQKVVAGSDGRVAWRHTPWFGAHAAKGGVRPLRRALQASKGIFRPDIPSPSSPLLLSFHLSFCVMRVHVCLPLLPPFSGLRARAVDFLHLCPGFSALPKIAPASERNLNRSNVFRDVRVMLWN